MSIELQDFDLGLRLRLIYKPFFGKSLWLKGLRGFAYPLGRIRGPITPRLPPVTALSPIHIDPGNGAWIPGRLSMPAPGPLVG